MLVGDTRFEPVTSSVSVISGPHDNAAVGANEVRGCTHLMARLSGWCQVLDDGAQRCA
jgi:hypothetical protein